MREVGANPRVRPVFPFTYFNDKSVRILDLSEALYLTFALEFPHSDTVWS